MYQLMNNIFKKQKALILLGVASFLIVIPTFLWINSARVSANVLPIWVNVEHLDFGNVFPGETLEGNFIVNYATTSEGVVVYRIVQKIKPLPNVSVPPGYELISNYCQDNPNDFSKCYRNLCPFLEKVSVETEGDTENLASVGPEDLSDAWIIYFKVPAIFGQVGQDHIGGVVDSEGEYGCDVSIDIFEQ